MDRIGRLFDVAKTPPAFAIRRRLRPAAPLHPRRRGWHRRLRQGSGRACGPRIRLAGPHVGRRHLLRLLVLVLVLLGLGLVLRLPVLVRLLLLVLLLPLLLPLLLLLLLLLLPVLPPPSLIRSPAVFLHSPVPTVPPTPLLPPASILRTTIGTVDTRRSKREQG